MIVDSHCHLDSGVFDADRDEVIERAREAGVELMLAIGTGEGPPDLEAALRLADSYPEVYATVGVHPHDARKLDQAALESLRELCAHPKVLAVGEIGLDYHYDHSPRAAQKRAFIEQMEVAREAKKPIVIHTREAISETAELLIEHWARSGLGGIMHCYSGDAAQAAAFLDMGFHLSFAGVLTFRRSDELRKAAAEAPLDRILVETDAPYLTPEPHRKVRRNEPRFVVETARRLAEARGIEYERVAIATTGNFRRLFDLLPAREAV